MTAPILHSQLFPDRVQLLRRDWRKDAGLGAFAAAPAGTTFVVIRLVAVGGQGESPGGNGAFAARKAKCAAGEVLQYQVGQCGTGGSAGDSWVRRASTGEMLCYADRGHGSGGVQGDAAKCIGNAVYSGVAGVGSGSDATDPAGLGFGGKPASATQAPGPGGGGQGNVYPSVTTRYPAGQGRIAVEYYAGDPGTLTGPLVGFSPTTPSAQTNDGGSAAISIAGATSGFAASGQMTASMGFSAVTQNMAGPIQFGWDVTAPAVILFGSDPTASSIVILFTRSGTAPQTQSATLRLVVRDGFGNTYTATETVTLNFG